MEHYTRSMALYKRRSIIHGVDCMEYSVLCRWFPTTTLHGAEAPPAATPPAYVWVVQYGVSCTEYLIPFRFSFFFFAC